MPELLEKQGYKQTELGWIPEAWNIIKIKDVGDIITGSTPKTANKDFYLNGTRLWASPSDLGKEKHIENTQTKLSELGFNQTRKICKKSILVTCIGSTIGKIGMAGQEMSTNQQINSIVCNKKHDPDFYYYVIDNISDFIKRMASTQAVPILNKTDFSNLEVIEPSLPEQQKIAEILSTVDEKIDCIDKQIEQTEQLKKGLMQELLTKGIGHNEFKDTEIGRIPKSWIIKKLAELSIQKIQNGIFNDPKKVGKGYKLINVVNLYTEPKIKTNNLKLLEANQDEYNSFKVYDGDIFFTRSSLKKEGIAHCNIYDSKDNEDILFECHIIRMRPNKNIISPFYLFRYCRTQTARKHFMANAKTTTMTTIDQKGIGEIQVPIPPLKEQYKIAEILGSVDEKLETLQDKKSEYENLKKGLMQKLLTGQIRVRV